jgi:hypothetical protein
MQVTNDLRDILNAAEQAVGREDHASAERLLREALALQELNSNGQRDEIAKTLNNLAIVCEMLGKMGDAETCYRRAYAIATASLPANDPFVTTSRENLEEFCKANGLPIQRPPAPRHQPASKPLFAAPPPQPAATAPPPRPVATTQPGPTAQPSTPATPAAPRVVSAGEIPLHRVPAPLAVPATRRSSRGVVTTVMGVVVLAVVVGGGSYWLASNGAMQPSVPTPVKEASTAPAPDAPSTVTPAPDPVPPTPIPLIETAATAAPTPPATAPPTPKPEPEPVALPPPPPATAPSSSVSIVSAQICRSLTTSGAWQCAEASGPQNPGTLSYFTRVASTRDTTIEHRWYRDDRLHQSVPLRIRANGSGFRTYSRTTIGRERAGTWTVETRTQDGQLLDERTFEVR